MRIGAAAILLVWCWAIPAEAVGPVDAMIELTAEGQTIEGAPLAWDARQVHLLGRDGQLWEFDPARATSFRQTSRRFSSYSTSELRAILLRILGQGYEVSGTGHYLVAHPRGQRDKWAGRFEELYRSFVHYFSVRGFELTEPPFPLLGIVCKDRADFHRYASEPGQTVPAATVGIYSLISNRIVLYDMQADEDSPGWEENASVIVHEATHQTAFNTGVHSRYAPPPLWVIEGLATMFEAPGVYDSRHHTRRSDRVNRGRFEAFRERVVPGHRPETLRAMIGSDRGFQADPVAAYAEAWALSFYLVETQRSNYGKYLAVTARRSPFTDYTSHERTADFEAVFGDDWQMFEAGFLRFMAGVK
jgi:hypothetical protein